MLNDDCNRHNLKTNQTKKKKHDLRKSIVFAGDHDNINLPGKVMFKTIDLKKKNVITR